MTRPRLTKFERIRALVIFWACAFVTVFTVAAFMYPRRVTTTMGVVIQAVLDFIGNLL